MRTSMLCTAVVVFGLAMTPLARAADSAQERRELDKLQGYDQLPQEKDVQKALTNVPNQPVESLIIWSEAKPTSGAAPLSVSFSADPPAGVDTPTYSWTFGDGSPAASGASVSHTFTKPGIYKVLLKVSNAKGALGEDEQRIKVTP